ncbi:GIN domain-containing protein [Pedobacter sp.]|uniref:GIN domain-containing protein n=1 Tax=Pedobacter sp. TaxID=1411316 RepID=UPI003D7F54C3
MKNSFLLLLTGLSLTSLTSMAQQKNITSFETLCVSGGGDIEVFYSKGPTLEIKGEESCINKIGIAQSSGTLSITVHENCKKPTQIFIGTPSLKRINQKGGGNIEIKKGFGTFIALSCTVRGGGNTKVLDSINFLSASVYGGGTLSAHVNKLLEGKVSDGGSIFYKGTAVVKSNILDGGVIKKL